jgi:hypothetical protein
MNAPEVKQLGRFTPCNKIEIWAPRWRDRVVLIAKHKVGVHNEVVFTKSKSLPNTYYLSGETIRACPTDTNGKLSCYAVPVDKLMILERFDIS